MKLSYPTPPLTDGVIVLRRWEGTDLGCVEQASLDRRIPEMTTVPVVFTEAEGREWMKRQWSRLETGQGLSLAIADTASHEALGAVVLMLRPQGGQQQGTAELGYWLIERARGNHLAARAIALLAPWTLSSAGFARPEALVEPDNVASQRALEAAGFRREGHLRSYLAFPSRRADALIYSLLPHDVA